MSENGGECMGYGLFGRCGETSGSDEPSQTAIQIRISGSVGRQGKNSSVDVKTIQGALNRVPINQGRPNPLLVVDGYNGSKTEQAIYVFQKHHFGAGRADARVDPEHRTIAKLNELQPQTNGPGGGSTGSAGSSLVGTSRFVPMTDSEKEVITQLEASVTLGLRWAMKAVVELLSAIEHIEGTKGREPSYNLVDRCFKIRSLSTKEQQRHAINKIIHIFNRMPRARRAVSPFVRKGGKCKNKDGDKVFAEAIMGGFHSEIEDRRRIKTCVDNMRGKNVYFMTDAMVHEMAHLVGPASGPNMIWHGGRANPAYALDALELNHREALISASNYAWLAWLARLPVSEWMTNIG